MCAKDHVTLEGRMVKQMAGRDIWYPVDSLVRSSALHVNCSCVFP